MAAMQKGKSPFYPDQPVPIELFVGRGEQINKIIERGVAQVSHGKPVAMFIEGEYGIGKSSVASYVQWLARKDYGLHGINASLGACENLDDVAEAILKATVTSGAFDPTTSEKLRDWLARYVGRQGFFGLNFNFEALKKDAPAISSHSSMLDFLGEVKRRLEDSGVKGIFLVLDELNGITSNSKFAYFIKSLWDTNAITPRPLPLFLLLCGVQEHRFDMIRRHEPVSRIFDPVNIPVLSDDEMEAFFVRAFESVNMSVKPSAMKILTHFSAGLPKIMHLIGNAAFLIDKDNVIDDSDAFAAVEMAADDVGRKYVDQQVYRTIRSADYHSILNKVVTTTSGPDSLTFKRADVFSLLTDTEKGRFNNFIKKMKELNVIKAGDSRGEYVFNVRMVHLYIFLQSKKTKKV